LRSSIRAAFWKGVRLDNLLVATQGRAILLLRSKPIAEERSILERLTESGIVDARGEGKNRSYRFSAHTYKRLGQKAAYVRQRGFEPVQVVQMVGQYLEAYGKITRKEAAELCKTTSTQARDLLSRLVKKGILKMYGSKKGAYFADASKNMDEIQIGFGCI